jgi:hypothetical protein
MEHKIKVVYTIIEPDKTNKLQKSLFRRIGTAFTNSDDSLNIMLDALPVNGKLHVRDLEPKREEGRDDKQEVA